MDPAYRRVFDHYIDTVFYFTDSEWQIAEINHLIISFFFIDQSV